MPEASRVLHVREIAGGHLARLRARAQAAARGYSLLSWPGPAPGRYTGQVAALHQDGEDAPHDDGHERKHWDAARVRTTERLAADQGLRHYAVAARHDRTGELVALTELEVDPLMPEWGYQGLTVVARAHRGQVDHGQISSEAAKAIPQHVIRASACAGRAEAGRTGEFSPTIWLSPAGVLE